LIHGLAVKFKEQGGEHRLVLVDLLRFIAAISVVFFHYCFRGERGAFVPPLGLPDSLQTAASYGGMGVYLFFVVSGFVIAYSAHGRSAWVFAASRFARLYPTYGLAVTVTALVLAFSGGVSVVQYVANLLMFPKVLHQPMVDGVYWSIQYEVLFYGWVFALVLLRVFDRWQTVVVAVWLVIAAFNLWVIKSGVLSMLFLTQYAGFFASGIMLFRLRREGFSGVTVLLLVAAMVIAGIAAHQEMKETLALYNAAYSPRTFFVILVLIYWFMGIATLHRGDVPWAEVMVGLGALTYPLYLLHQMIGYLLITLLFPLLSSYGALIVTIAIMLSLAFTVQYVFERPVVPWVRRFITGVFARLLKD
jgi:peptidoglycan/LPS O-acetylase OafA/YrhL